MTVYDAYSHSYKIMLHQMYHNQLMHNQNELTFDLKLLDIKIKDVFFNIYHYL